MKGTTQYLGHGDHRFQSEMRICGLRIINVITLGLRFVPPKSMMAPNTAAKSLILNRKRDEELPPEQRRKRKGKG